MKGDILSSVVCILLCIASCCSSSDSTRCVCCFHRAFPRRGRRILSAAAPGEAGPVPGPDRFPSEGTGRAESRSRHSLRRSQKGDDAT